MRQSAHPRLSYARMRAPTENASFRRPAQGQGRPAGMAWDVTGRTEFGTVPHDQRGRV